VVAPDVPVVVPESSGQSASSAPAADAAAAEIKPADAIAAQAPQPETSIQAPPRGTLRLEFTDRSWTQVEDGLGRVLEKRTVEAGSTNRYEGVLPFRVTLGNAVYVRVYFNDQEYDHLNDITDNNIARFQLGAPEVR
jgi:cytoskeleton protein RodZ